jgi:F-box domain
MQFDLIPSDIIREILGFLEPKHIFSLRRVSKQWKKLVEHIFNPSLWLTTNEFFYKHVEIMSLHLFEDISMVNSVLFRNQLTSSYLPSLDQDFRIVKKRFGARSRPKDVIQNDTLIYPFGKSFQLSSGHIMIQTLPFKRIRSMICIDFISMQGESKQRHIFSQVTKPLWISELIVTDQLYVLMLDQKYLLWWSRESFNKPILPILDNEDNYVFSNGQLLELSLWSFFPWTSFEVSIRPPLYNIWMLSFTTNHRDSALGFKASVFFYWLRFLNNRLEYSVLKRH